MLKHIWLVVLLLVLCWGCQETEVLETYEQVKETLQPVPFSFEPYVMSQQETSANTRADLSYLSYITNSTTDFNLPYFNFIPCLGLNVGTCKTWSKLSDDTNTENDPKYNYRFGLTATNSYIVGVYAFSHSSTWSSSSSAATANVMTNQPLLRVPKPKGNGFENINGFDSNKQGYARALNNISLWDYEPKKYWPVGEKVTFISYYPYQDYVGRTYYRDGTGSRANEHVTLSGVEYWDPYETNPPVEYPEADLTCITPPPADATGTDAYTFKFRQLNNVQKHIDFLLGLTTYETNTSVALPLKHTLCAVQFNFRDMGSWTLQSGQKEPKKIEIKVNSIGFKGLYTKGEVYPNADNSAHWGQLDNYNAEEKTKYGSDEDTYMVTFDDNTGKALNPPFMKPDVDDRPTFTYTGNGTSGSWTYYNRTSSQIYTNGAYNGGVGYGGNSRGFRYLLLVIPQKAQLEEDNTTAKESYLVIDYDYSYTWTDPTTNTDQKVSFQHTVSKLKLSDSAKKTNKTQLFIANKMLTFNVKITPAGIGMDVEETDWDETVDRQLPIENKETESGSGN